MTTSPRSRPKPRDWPNLTWSEKTWSERAQSLAASAMALGIMLVMAGAVLYAIGGADHVISANKAERTNCLKHAENGLEIEQCR